MADVVISLEFGGSDVEVDVALAVVHLGREEVAGKLPDLLRPRRRPHLHLELRFENLNKLIKEIRVASSMTLT